MTPTQFVTSAFGAMQRMWARSTKPEQPGGWLINVGGVKIPGVYISNWRQALQSPTVWRGVYLISSTIAMLPWNVLKAKPDGSAETVPTDDEVQWLLHDEPSPELTAFDWRRTIIAHSIAQGNGYAEIERNRRGQAKALHLIDDPDRVTPARVRETGELVYEVQNSGGGKAVLEQRDIFHVRGLATDGVVGLGILDVARRTVSLNVALDIMEQKYFTQGMKTPGFIKTKGKMSMDGLKAVIKLIQKEFTGLENFEMPIPLDQDMEWQPAGSTLRNAQFIEVRKAAILDLCRVLGIPPHKAFELDRATFSNIEHQGQDFVNDALLPRITPMEQEANRKLLSSRFAGRYSKINVNALVRGDMQARTAFYKEMRMMGVFTVNDILRLEDRPTIGPEGDVRVMQMQFQPTSGGGAQTEPPPGDDDDDEGEAPPPPAQKKQRRNRANGRAHVNGGGT